MFRTHFSVSIILKEILPHTSYIPNIGIFIIPNHAEPGWIGGVPRHMIHHSRIGNSLYRANLIVEVEIWSI